MTRRTRLFVLSAAAILIAGIGTAGLASYVGFGNIGLRAQDAADELSYVPDTAQLVAFMDVRHFMDSELRTRLQLGLGTNQHASSLFGETGINIETDVDTVLVAMLGAEGAGNNRPPLVVARGRFDAPRIEASFRARGGAADEHNGIRMVTSEDQQLGVAFIESGLLAIGSPDALRAAVDAGAADAGTVKSNADLMRLIDRVDDSDAWTVARFDALQGRAPIPGDLANQLPSIAWLSAAGRFSDGVSAVVHAEARDEQAAQDLREVVRGFVALVRMQVGQQAEFADFMNSVELSGEGTTVSLGFSISPELIDRLGALQSRPPAGAAPRRTPARSVNPSI
jgi:hypothetical protein